MGEYEANGKKRYVYGKTKKEVAAKLAKAIADRDAGLVYDSGKLTVGAYLDKWLDAIRDTLRNRTVQRHEQIARLHLKPTLGKVKLDRLNALKLQTLCTVRSSTQGYYHSPGSLLGQDHVEASPGRFGHGDHGRSSPLPFPPRSVL